MGEDDLAAGGDRIYPIVGWEERGGETNVYSTDGEYLTTPEGWHSWGWRGGPAMAVDADHVYCSMGHDPGDGGGEKFAGVARYTRDGKPAPFAGGKGGYGLEINGDQHKKPTPLAVYGGEALAQTQWAGGSSSCPPPTCARCVSFPARTRAATRSMPLRSTRCGSATPPPMSYAASAEMASALKPESPTASSLWP